MITERFAHCKVFVQGKH